MTDRELLDEAVRLLRGVMDVFRTLEQNEWDQEDAFLAAYDARQAQTAGTN